MTRPASLRADCANCFALCCIAPAFAASADFAIDKPAGQPCQNLRPDFRCGIHDRLRTSGFRGCAAYDCFGAGQKVSRVTFAQQRGATRQMLEVFPVMRQLHELVWYLTEALTLPGARPLHARLRAARDETERLGDAGPDELLALDVAGHRDRVAVLLRRASELVRTKVRPQWTDHSGADLAGADLHGADLRGASLRGAYLIGADLRAADLRSADLIGADLRGADLSGADLTDSLYMTQSQVDAANGDAGTRLRPALIRPAHW